MAIPGNVKGIPSKYNFVIDGRPHFAKLSIDDGKKVKIAAIDRMALTLAR